MVVHKVFLSNRGYKEKPKGAIIATISNKILSEPFLFENPEDLAKQLTEDGRAVLLSSARTKRGELGEQTIIMMDFDNKGNESYTISDLEQDVFMQNNACFYYKTYNHLENGIDRFRVVFILDTPCTTHKEVEMLYKALFERYPMSDRSVGQASRIFFGSNKSYEVIDSDNILNKADMINEYIIESKKPKEITVKSEELGTRTEMLTMDTPNYILLKYKQYDWVSEKLGNNFSGEFPDEYVAGHFFKSIDMKELLELPDDNPFFDILHEEENPSASVFYADDYDIYFYKCFSNSNKFTGDILALLEIYLQMPSVYVIDLLIDITNSTINKKSELGIQKYNATMFKESLISGSLNRTHPELYALLKRYSMEVSLTLDFMFNYVYSDNEGNTQYLNYYSLDKLTQILRNNLNKNITRERVKTIINLVVVTEMIQKLPDYKIPSDLYNTLIAPQKNESKQIRTSTVYAPSDLSIEHQKAMQEIAGILKENNVTVGSLSYELIYRLFGKEKADRDFPQAYRPLIESGKVIMSNKDSNLTERSIEIEKEAIKYIMKEIKRTGYVYEERIIKKISKEFKLNTLTTKDIYNKMRADILNKYGLKRTRLTKKIYLDLNVKGKYSNKIIYIIE